MAADLVAPPQNYLPRVVDAQVAEFVGQLPAVALEGAKAVGKTATALQYARTVYALDDPQQFEVAAADEHRLLVGEHPILIDEWQRVPATWDLVRRAVDAPGATAGSYLLTGSALPPPEATTHSDRGTATRSSGLATPQMNLTLPSGAQPLDCVVPTGRTAEQSNNAARNTRDFMLIPPIRDATILES